jgi:hypothetical protein
MITAKQRCGLPQTVRLKTPRTSTHATLTLHSTAQGHNPFCVLGNARTAVTLEPVQCTPKRVLLVCVCVPLACAAPAAQLAVVML